MTSQIESIYKTILNDTRVRAVVDKITHHFPNAPFIAIVTGTGAASEAATFILIPLLNLVPGVSAAGSLAGLVRSAVSGKPVPPGSISTLLQSVVAAGLGVPTLVVGTVMNGTVRAVKVLREKANEGKGSSELNTIGGEGRSVGDETEVCGGESSEPVAEGADPTRPADIKGDEPGKASDTPPESAPSAVGYLVSGVSKGVAKAGEVLDTTWTVAKTVLFVKHHSRPKL
ncbi:hypothetical protein FRC06_001317 [Ceratobasidium sp. 370]|nr:hypothetical protein FRC06_001317 [Ceratobasidium sp. 370]